MALDLDNATRPRRTATICALGVVVGVVLTAAGVIGTDPTRTAALPDSAVARVNGRFLTRELVERVTRDVGVKRNVPADADLRRTVIEGLIDEELLVQRGIELGLPRVDRRVRTGLTRAAIERIMMEQERVQPTDAELQAFLTAHPEIFAPAAKLRMRHILFRVVGGDTNTALLRAQKAAARLAAGDDFAAVKKEEGDAELAPIPDALLTRTKLLDYVGPAVVQAAVTLSPGETSPPTLAANSYHLVQVIERDASALPDLARVRDQAMREYQRKAGDTWLRTTLERLRDEAAIVTND